MLKRSLNQGSVPLGTLQRRYGSFQPNQWQNLRRIFYSAVKYPTAGSSQLTFFGNTLSSAGYNKQLTNIPKPNSFGTNHMLIKAITLDVFLADYKREAYASTDATTFAADMLYGFANAGVLEFKVGARKVLEVCHPFRQCPTGNGAATLHSTGLSGVGAGTAVAPAPMVEFVKKRQNRFILDPNVLIQSEEQFELTLSYPSGLVPIMSTSVVDDTTNPLYIVASFDGIVYRPVQ